MASTTHCPLFVGLPTISGFGEASEPYKKTPWMRHIAHTPPCIGRLTHQTLHYDPVGARLLPTISREQMVNVRLLCSFVRTSLRHIQAPINSRSKSTSVDHMSYTRKREKSANLTRSCFFWRYIRKPLRHSSVIFCINACPSRSIRNLLHPRILLCQFSRRRQYTGPQARQLPAK